MSLRAGRGAKLKSFRAVAGVREFLREIVLGSYPPPAEKTLGHDILLV